jgi:PPM family protein phosphatase
MIDGTAVAEEESPGQSVEITARFSRAELVRAWRRQEGRAPAQIPVVRFGARTDLGRIRENNEDKFDFYEPEDPGLLACRGYFYAVADGMGGHAAGQIACEMALKHVIAQYFDSPGDDIPEALLAAIRDASTRVYELAVMIPEHTGMGTTLTATVFVEDRVYLAQVGDSRAYLIRDGAIRQVTEDHSWVAEQVRIGGMTELDAELSPYRNVITRSIGTQPLVDPDLFVEQVRVGDTWVLCTDGLTGHVRDEEILQVVSDIAPAEACRQLVELASARGGRDNITVIVLNVRDLVSYVGSAPGAVAEQVTETAPEPIPAPHEKRGLRKLLGR